jgi:hypothetical protein
MRIERFESGADESRIRSCYEIVMASQRLDDPGLPIRAFTSFRNRWTSGFGGHPRRTWHGVDDTGKPLGCYLLTLPELDSRSWPRTRPKFGTSPRGTPTPTGT